MFGGNLNPYEIHKKIINDYILNRPGATKLLNRDTSKDKRDLDIIRENHKFLWDEDSSPQTWEGQLAKKYYDKLFKEYCICDLSRYKENKVALRWRIEREVVAGRGQFSCGNKLCDSKNELRTWEVNFAYEEQGEKKNALVKLRLCPDCSRKLNYHSKKREIRRLKSKKSTLLKHKTGGSVKSVDKEETSESEQMPESSTDKINESNDSNMEVSESEENLWQNKKHTEEKSREEEFEDYLEALLL